MAGERATVSFCWWDRELPLPSLVMENLLLTSVACLSLRTFSAHPHKRKVFEWWVSFHRSFGPWRTGPLEQQCFLGSPPTYKTWIFSLDKAGTLRLTSLISISFGITVLYCLMSTVMTLLFQFIFSCFRVEGKSSPCYSILTRSRSPSTREFNILSCLHLYMFGIFQNKKCWFFFFFFLKVNTWCPVVQKVFEGKQWCIIGILFGCIIHKI